MKIVVCTPQYLQSETDKTKQKFIEPGYLPLVVQKLTEEIILEAIEAYELDREDSYWLKFFHYTDGIDISVLNKLQADQISQWEEWEAQ